MAIFRVIFRFSGHFNLWRLSPKNNLKRFLGYSRNSLPLPFPTGVEEVVDVEWQEATP